MNMNKKNLRYFLYCRKSSESSERQVQSIEDQINNLTTLASTLGINIVKTFTEEKSAKKPGIRPIFTQMMKEVEEGKADGILCWQLNRLSRNPIDSAQINWFLQEGILKSVQTSDREYQTGDNVVVFSVESSIGNQFIIDLKKNTRRGVIGKLKRGGYPSRAPLGYLNNKLDKTIERDIERFDMVRHMWDLMLTGNYSPAKIVDIANNDWGFRTPSSWRSGGKPLSKSSLYRVFSNRFYTGLMEWDGELYEGTHDKMITTLEFDRVQKLLGRGKNMTESRHKYKFAFTGMIQCGSCGGSITAEKKKKKLKNGDIAEYTYYRCTKNKKYATCDQNGCISEAKLEEQIQDRLKNLTIDQDFLQWALDGLNEANGFEVAKQNKVRNMQMNSLERTQENLASLTQMRYRNLIDDQEFLSEKRKLQKEITELQSVIDESEQMNTKWREMTERTFNFAAHAHQAFIEGDIDTKKEIFAALGPNFVLQDKKLSIAMHSWLKVLESSYPELKAQLDGCGPDKYGNVVVSQDELGVLSPIQSLIDFRGDYRDTALSHSLPLVALSKPTVLNNFLHGETRVSPTPFLVRFPVVKNQRYQNRTPCSDALF